MAEERVESGEWQTARNAWARSKPTAKSADNTEKQAQNVPKTKMSTRKASPKKKTDKAASKEGGHRQTGVHAGGVDQGDGRVVFMQLRRYLVNAAPKEYVYHMVLRLNALARGRRFQDYMGSLDKKDRTADEEEELRKEWQDESTPELQTRYQGLSSYWDFESKDHVERVHKLMQDWIIQEHLPQEEIEERIRLFRFVNSPSEPSPAVEEKGSAASYIKAVTGASTLQHKGGETEEQRRLYDLCLQPVAETLKLRERTPDEDKALLMILNHEIEVPFPPRFLVQSMDARELACFTDIFMAIEYPLYAHLAPGQTFSPNLSKQALLAQIHMGEEAAPPQKQEIRDFKEALSRITLDVNTRVLTVTFKGKRSAARWINWQVPLAMKMLPLVDYEREREFARTTHAPVKLDYYRFSAAVRRGELASKDLHWLLTKKLGLKVQSMVHPVTHTAGINDKQWTLTIQASACPLNLRDTAFVRVDSTELLVNHHEVHVNWPCMACYAPDHPTKFCRTTETATGESKKEHTVNLAGQLPSKLGKGSRTYGKIAHPTTLDQLKCMLAADKELDPISPEWDQHFPPQPPKNVSAAALNDEVSMRIDEAAVRPTGGDGDQEEQARGQERHRVDEEEAKTSEQEQGGLSEDVEMKEVQDFKEEPSTEHLVENAQENTGSDVQGTAMRGRSPTRKNAGRGLTSRQVRRNLTKTRDNAGCKSPTDSIGQDSIPDFKEMPTAKIENKATSLKAASTSPKRRAPDEWDNGREYGDTTHGGIVKKTSRREGMTRSLSPTRQGRTELPKATCSATQIYMHQFLQAALSEQPTQTTDKDQGNSDSDDVRPQSHKQEEQKKLAQCTAVATDDCQFTGVKASTDAGCHLTTWLAMVGGSVVDVPATGQCGWLAFFAVKNNLTEGLLPMSAAVASATNELKKHVLNGVIANLGDEARLHPVDFMAELKASGAADDQEFTMEEQLCALANHYVAQRKKSVKATVPQSLWVRPAHIKAMAMHTREQVFVLDVDKVGIARMPVYMHQETTLNDDDVAETGSVIAVPTNIATNLLQELVDAGILPMVMILQWREQENHFQAVSYDHERYKCYNKQKEELTRARNTILVKYGCRAVDANPSNPQKTARAAARELKSLRRAVKKSRQRSA